MEAVRTIRPSRFPLPIHNLPLSQHKRLPANENAANENGSDSDGDPLAAAALAVLEAAERAGHLPPMTTEKFIAACKLTAANLPPANDDATEPAQAPAAPIATNTPEGFEFECWGCEVKSRAEKANAVPAGWRLVGNDRENYVYCEDCGPTDAQIAAGAPWDVHAAATLAPYVNANFNPDDHQAPEQGA